MMRTGKRSLALLMALVLCVAFLPMLRLDADAADFSYVYSGKYIYNWGTRGEAATFLSPNAEAFYTGSNAYEVLSAYAGGSGVSDAPDSDLYDALQDLMKNAHSHITSYEETKNLYQYTDCQNNGGKISSFYSGAEIGPSWNGSWNREHTWPNSKGLAGDDENDIMMLRPTSTSENSSRGNKAYGESGGYYHPNSESNNRYDLRGDVARIFLYVYVRWGNVNGNGKYTAWGASGVMESVEVLLAWMEADPVDTWELGRNDSVQSITGTRNVFVDYPELAFLLFGAEVPDGMSTPSGEGSQRCDHNNFDQGVTVAPTCTAKGYTLYTCRTEGCGYCYQSNVIAAKGHSYVSGICSACGAVEPSKPTYATEIVPGKAYKLGMFSTDKNAEYYFNGSMSGYYGATVTDFAKGVDVFAEEVNGGYRLYFMNGTSKQYINLVVSGTYRNFTFSGTATTVFTWDAEKNALKTTLADETCYMGTYGTYVTVGVLQASKLRDTDYIARLYNEKGGAAEDSCAHQYEAVVTAPTCTKGGYTTHTCGLCGDHYVSDQLSAIGHSYQNGVCVRCGVTELAPNGITISFRDKANRTVFTTSQQVWEQNGITVTNNKASASSNVADYGDPVRFYQGSDVIIAYPGMVKLEIDCSGLDAKYVNSWMNVSGGTATKNNGIVTVVFKSPVDSVTYSRLPAQSRAYSITVYVEEGIGSCQHESTVVEGAVEATCTEQGQTGKTRCLDCNAVISGNEVIPAKGHSFEAWTEEKAPTCANAGEARRVCESCAHFETKVLSALEHQDADKDGLCDLCDEKLLGEAETEPETEPETDAETLPEKVPTTQPATTEENGQMITVSCSGTIAGAPAGLLVLMSVGAVLTVRKKKDR